MTLTKKYIIDNIQDRLLCSKGEAREFFNDLLEIIKSTLSNNEDIMISGFGKFCLNEKVSRIGRNPSTKKDMVINKRKVITFKCSGTLRDVINRK
ncbi:MAG: integration host factor subunit alpha [Desulfobacteraceae bacterium 4572_19]|nr:MAG: integration host factor subunit alpha [Desulfobacteraceae bacterium 4572_19]